MGSFRSAPSRRASDIRTLTADERPMLNGRIVTPEQWLQPGEWIQYWHVLPHSAVSKVAGAGTEAIFDGQGDRKSVRYDAGRAIRARVSEGVIDWRMADENGTDVMWNAAQADMLLDGLPDAVYLYLTKVIGAGASQPSLAAPDPEGKPGPDGEVPPLGEESAESSTPS